MILQFPRPTGKRAHMRCDTTRTAGLAHFDAVTFRSVLRVIGPLRGNTRALGCRRGFLAQCAARMDLRDVKYPVSVLPGYLISPVYSS